MVEHRNLKRASTKNTEPQEFETWKFIAVKSFFTEKEFGKKHYRFVGFLPQTTFTEMAMLTRLN